MVFAITVGSYWSFAVLGWVLPATGKEHEGGGLDEHGPVVELVLQPEIVIFMVAGRLAGGSGRHERGLAGGVATTTSATGGLDPPRVRRPGWRTGAGSRCRSTE
jgi:hypothetical protein